MSDMKKHPSHGPIFKGPGGRFYPLPEVKVKDPLGTLKKLWKYLENYKFFLISVFFLVLISSGLNITGTYFIGKGIDEFIIPRKFDGFSRFLLILLIIYLSGVLFSYISSYIMMKISQRVVLNMRKDLFDKIQSLPLKFFDLRPYGDIISRFTNDIDNIAGVLGGGIIFIFSAIINIFGTLFVMIKMNLLLTLISMVTIPLTVLITNFITRKTRDLFFTNQTILGKLNGIIEEDISGLKTIKIFSREKKEIEKFGKVNEELKNVGLISQIFSGTIGPLMNALNNLSFAVIAGVGGWLAYKNLVSIGTISVFINYSKQFTRPINEIANQFNMLQLAIASAERIFEIMDEKSEEETKDFIEIEDIKGEIEFRNVSFSYKEGQEVLKNISFHIKPGQKVAIVGPTGAGKTTIVNLITRFYEVEKGEILIDGINIRKIKKENLRKVLGIVLQDTYLFSGTIMENIKYGKPDATEEDVKIAAKLAHVDEFINFLPDKYNTVISEDGSCLSHGQRQLISIARTFLLNPKILILDEATSNVDTLTEKYIQSAVLRLMEGKTSIIIAHRLSTVKNADLILVLNNGEIIEKGTHNQLLEKKGFYYHLYMSQFGEEIEISIS